MSMNTDMCMSNFMSNGMGNVMSNLMVKRMSNSIRNGVSNGMCVLNSTNNGMCMHKGLYKSNKMCLCIIRYIHNDMDNSVKTLITKFPQMNQ